MIYEHSATSPVSKIQVTDVDRLYAIWAAQPEYFALTKDVFYDFLKTTEAQIFIRQHQSLSVTLEGDVAVLTSKFI